MEWNGVGKPLVKVRQSGDPDFADQSRRLRQVLAQGGSDPMKNIPRTLVYIAWIETRVTGRLEYAWLFTKATGRWKVEYDRLPLQLSRWGFMGNNTIRPPLKEAFELVYQNILHRGFPGVIAYQDPARYTETGEDLKNLFGFSLDGWTDMRIDRFKILGEVIHARQVNSRYGSSSLEWLRENVDPNAEALYDQGKMLWYRVPQEVRQYMGFNVDQSGLPGKTEAGRGLNSRGRPLTSYL